MSFEVRPESHAISASKLAQKRYSFVKEVSFGTFGLIVFALPHELTERWKQRLGPNPHLNNAAMKAIQKDLVAIKLPRSQPSIADRWECIILYELGQRAHAGLRYSEFIDSNPPIAEIIRADATVPQFVVMQAITSGLTLYDLAVYRPDTPKFYEDIPDELRGTETMIHPVLPIELICHFFCQLSQSICTLHNLGFCHHDIAIPNIMVDTEASEQPPSSGSGSPDLSTKLPNLRLVDFGNSQELVSKPEDNPDEVHRDWLCFCFVIQKFLLAHGGLCENWEPKSLSGERSILTGSHSATDPASRPPPPRSVKNLTTDPEVWNSLVKAIVLHSRDRSWNPRQELIRPFYDLADRCRKNVDESTVRYIHRLIESATVSNGNRITPNEVKGVLDNYNPQTPYKTNKIFNVTMVYV